jgi:hypothetical protein
MLSNRRAAAMTLPKCWPRRVRFLFMRAAGPGATTPDGQGQGGAVCGVPDEVDPSGPRPFGQAFFARTR